MSLKENWKTAGKDLGKSLLGLGKTVLKSAKVGVEAVLDETPSEQRQPKDTGLRESWAEVGHSFGQAARSVGTAVGDTADAVANELDKKP